MMHWSLVNNVAARIGKAEFLEPLMRTDPFKVVPPWTMILSIDCENEAFNSLIIRMHDDVPIIVCRQQAGDFRCLVDADFQGQEASGPQARRGLSNQTCDDL